MAQDTTMQGTADATSPVMTQEHSVHFPGNGCALDKPTSMERGWLADLQSYPSDTA
jgi:hypothetical protein